MTMVNDVAELKARITSLEANLKNMQDRDATKQKLLTNLALSLTPRALV
ncbi:MAG: hypothetical protein FWD37_02180 [Methanomassiliicoccaceae archaeon]|nr:hypothetical protein [Methanomassiliicoccaceae archaeon]